MARRVAILGSTGSIGCQTLEVIDALNAGGAGFEIVALAANRNVAKLAEQTLRYRPKLVVLADESALHPSASDGPQELEGLEAHGAQVKVGPGALAALAAHPDVDIVVHAVVGAAGLRASFAAAQAGKRLALGEGRRL